MESVAQKRPLLSEPRNIHREVLSNGLLVLSEEMQHIRSVSIGIWMKTGSRDEAAEVNGISHFVEHMVFKGTTHHRAVDISRWVESLGGAINAETAKEYTHYYIDVPSAGARAAA